MGSLKHCFPTVIGKMSTGIMIKQAYDCFLFTFWNKIIYECPFLIGRHSCRLLSNYYS